MIEQEAVDEYIKALEKTMGKKNVDRILGKAACIAINTDAALSEALAHLRTLANFGGTVEQARELAQRGIDRVEGMI